MQRSITREHCIRIVGYAVSQKDTRDKKTSATNAECQLYRSPPKCVEIEKARLQEEECRARGKLPPLPRLQPKETHRAAKEKVEKAEKAEEVAKTPWSPTIPFDIQEPPPKERSEALHQAPYGVGDEGALPGKSDVEDVDMTFVERAKDGEHAGQGHGHAAAERGGNSCSHLVGGTGTCPHGVVAVNPQNQTGTNGGSNGGPKTAEGESILRQAHALQKKIQGAAPAQELPPETDPVSTSEQSRELTQGHNQECRSPHHDHADTNLTQQDTEIVVDDASDNEGKDASQPIESGSTHNININPKPDHVPTNLDNGAPSNALYATTCGRLMCPTMLPTMRCEREQFTYTSTSGVWLITISLR